MSEPPQVVTRPTRTAVWNLVRGDAKVANAYAVCRPDRRWFVSVDAWSNEDHEPLVAAMVANLRQDLYTRIDGSDLAALELWSRFGFKPDRRELEFSFSPNPERTGLVDVPLPKGLGLLPADEVDEAELRRLDDRLRAEVPGTEGWINDPAEFHDYTFDEAQFNPSTYLVAVDDVRRRFAGLVRIWVSSNRARLGLIAVEPAYRRQGLACGLLSHALQPVHERGVGEVSAEVDESNLASLNLLQRIGGVQTGSSMVLKRRSTTP